MKNNDFEKYITELSPELQEKARHCKNMDELNELLAANDVELSDDALEAVAGGCTNSNRSTGDPSIDLKCTECGGTLRYWDRTFSDGNRYYCDNGACVACQNSWLFAEIRGLNDGVDCSIGEVKRVK